MAPVLKRSRIEIEIGFRKIFGLPDSADGQRLAGFFK
jgi:hypothetical protein